MAEINRKGCNLKIISFIILTLAITCFGSEFIKLSEFVGMRNENKQDSGTVWVENPIPDVRMAPNETRSIDITDVFFTNPDSTSLLFDFPFSGNNLMVTGNLTLNEQTNRVYLDLVSKSVYGSTTMIVKVTSEFGTAADTLIVKVDDPSNIWLEYGTLYSFLPENCLGSGTSEWKAAHNFDLGTSIFSLKEIEFGYSWTGTTDWKIVSFNGEPTDSVIGTLYGSKSFNGGQAAYIESGFESSITGNIAVVFTTTANFMSMDPSGDSDHTWIYSEAAGWENPEDISADYAGAWYLRIFVKDTTGIIEEFTSEIVQDSYLLKNYPNPFNNETVIAWNLRNSGQVELNIFNSKGQLVKNLVNEAENKGTHSVIFNADGMETGIYFYQLKVNGIIENTAKMLYLK